MSTTNAIIAPQSGRDAYTSAVLSGVASARTTNERFQAAAVDAVRSSDERANSARPTSRRVADTGTHCESGTQSTCFDSKGAIPFLTQHLAQEGYGSFQDDAGENSESDAALPSVRFAARQAYGVALDSTVEFLSPTPVFDILV